ncbi:class I SAM-dependent methyltransferase [Streptomyces sp. NA02950]|uniref:methyltransferase domain-containing protein n=1 Tax=Streptomyces sp. NA02950 TaxID=2742137 RepID=UPI00158FE697|nr:methyltransferase domain-containing protein [Streptomyces sp. NA02950]QKV96013.1 class I SAM-dependent methyltransferase [Streptomyces sp. NA02950]
MSQENASAALDADSGYALGTTEKEYERLRQQAQVWADTTEAFLRRAGIPEGARCLDVGSGPGEVMRLLSRLAGPSATVTGVDIDGVIGREALRRLRDEESGRFEFHELDIESADRIPGGPYDVVFTRLVLLHLRNAVAGVRKMYEAVAPGGLLMVQDYDLRTWETLPSFEDSDLPREVLMETLRASGREPLIGPKLPAIFQAAGVPEPVECRQMGAMSFRKDGGMEVGFRVLHSTLPAALRLGVVTEERVQRFFANVDQRMRGDELLYQVSPSMVAAWVRKPL